MDSFSSGSALPGFPATLILCWLGVAGSADFRGGQVAAVTALHDCKGWHRLGHLEIFGPYPLTDVVHGTWPQNSEGSSRGWV